MGIADAKKACPHLVLVSLRDLRDSGACSEEAIHVDFKNVTVVYSLVCTDGDCTRVIFQAHALTALTESTKRLHQITACLRTAMCHAVLCFW
jgi:hypothetical protein